MEKVKKLVELAKANYEKAILVLVVLILAVAVGFLYWLSGEEQKKANETTGNYVRKKLNPPPAVDMAAYEQGLKVALNPPRVDFGLPHKLFNPVKWMRGQDGKLIVDRSGKSVGPEALNTSSRVGLRASRVSSRVTAPLIRLLRLRTSRGAQSMLRMVMMVSSGPR